MSTPISESIASINRLTGDESQLWKPVKRVLDVDGVAISTVADFLEKETVSASDPVATHIDEVQFYLGEGPCWDTLRSGLPVLAPDLRDEPPTTWPSFLDAIAVDDIGAIFAFPLSLGPLKLGAMDLYTKAAGNLDAQTIEHGSAIAQAISRLLLARALRDAGAPYQPDNSPSSRRVIHQAAGFVLSQLDISAADATLVIQGHAFSTGRPLKDIAQDIVERRISFVTSSGSIEGSDD